MPSRPPFKSRQLLELPQSNDSAPPLQSSATAASPAARVQNQSSTGGSNLVHSVPVTTQQNTSAIPEAEGEMDETPMLLAGSLVAAAMLLIGAAVLLCICLKRQQEQRQMRSDACPGGPVNSVSPTSAWCLRCVFSGMLMMVYACCPGSV
jgi:hypothetical protein